MLSDYCCVLQFHIGSVKSRSVKVWQKHTVHLMIETDIALIIVESVLGEAEWVEVVLDVYVEVVLTVEMREDTLIDGQARHDLVEILRHNERRLLLGHVGHLGEALQELAPHTEKVKNLSLLRI